MGVAVEAVKSGGKKSTQSANRQLTTADRISDEHCRGDDVPGGLERR
jgi:hypothetical protein